MSGKKIPSPDARLPELLLPWFRENARDLPWRRDREPYHVWLSEIMLQQTRAEAVRGYYERFIKALPDIPSLAAAPLDTVYKLWEGLGYYSRARNLHAAARQIQSERGGMFPTDYEHIRALKGVGDYTAGAIASICFDAPTPAVDGNVLRVVSRLTADGRPVDEEAVRSAVRAALAEIYPAGHCGEFTQALMELGAVVCVPNGAPACESCPVRALCASRDGDWKRFPVRAQKKPRRRERLTVFLLRRGDAVALRKRPDSGLLAGLWELPNVPGRLTPEQAVSQAGTWNLAPRELLREADRTHVFTHVEWDMRVYAISVRAPGADLVWADETELQKTYSLPTAFRKCLK